MLTKKRPILNFRYLPFLLLFLCVISAYAQPFSGAGTWDRSFGRGGIVFTPSGISGPNLGVRDVVIQPDGKILTGGVVGPVGSMRVTRYNSNGSLDASFGIGGTTTTTIGFISRINAVALQTDGKIVVGGEATNDFMVARYNSDGSLDDTFGAGGYVVTDLAGFEELSIERAHRVMILSDGKIAAIGQRTARPYESYPGDEYKGSILVLYYNADGTLDTSRGDSGKVVTPFTLLNYGVTSTAMTNDGGLIVTALGSGRAKPTSPETLYESVIVKYKADGTLDPDFAAGGIRLESGSANYKVIKSLPNGQFLVSSLNKVLLLNEGGEFVSEVSNGEAYFEEGGFGAQDYLVQDDGKLIATGIVFDGILNQRRSNVRFLPDGSVDPTFGSAGLGPALPTGFYTDSQFLRLQPDGKILNVATTPGSPHGIMMARFNGDSPPTPKDSKR